MDTPHISVVIPAYNEDACIGRTIAEVAAELEQLGVPWELIVADDGSVDGTAAAVRDRQRADPRIKLVSLTHRGKGAAVKQGMLAATGAWRFLADADLSMPIRELRLFLPPSEEVTADILIGSREVAGSARLEEPHYRHALGRFFNWVAKMLVVPGIEDT